MYLVLSVVIKGFYPKTGASKGAEHLLTQPAAMALVIIFFSHPLFCSSSRFQTPCIKGSDFSLLFSVHNSTEYISVEYLRSANFNNNPGSIKEGSTYFSKSGHQAKKTVKIPSKHNFSKPPLKLQTICPVCIFNAM